MQFRVKNFTQRNANKNMLRRYRIMLIVLFFCGFNFKVFKFFNRFRILSVVYSIALITVTVLATVYCSDNFNYLHIWALIEYIVSVFILIVYNSKLSEFSFRLSHIDTFLRINFRDYINDKKRIFLILLAVWSLRICYVTIHCSCFSCYKILSLYIISLFSSFALDMNRVWRFVLLDIVRNRLSLLRKRLEESSGCTYYLYVNNNKTFKEEKIKFLTNLYKNIANIISLINPEIHASMFISITCSLPKIVYNVYHILLVIEERTPLESIGFLIIHIFQVCFLLFSPCFIVEAQLMEVEKIRTILVHFLIDETDPRVKEDIQTFLTYTEIRSFQNKIWRCIPLNITLLVETANMCTSSIIVVINFTNLFG